MSDSPRLTELRQQRALVQKQLDWLDGEIARESGRESALNTPAPAPEPPRAPAPPLEKPVSRRSIPMPSGDPDAVMENYRVPPADLHRNIRNGCLFYFAAALLLVATGVAVLYLAFRK